MIAISYTVARENLAATMDKVCDDHAPIIVTRNRRPAVVLMSLEDFEAFEETASLLRNPKKARRVRSAIAQLDVGASEQSLAHDWNRPEEDAAWQHLQPDP